MFDYRRVYVFQFWRHQNNPKLIKLGHLHPGNNVFGWHPLFHWWNLGGIEPLLALGSIASK